LPFHEKPARHYGSRLAASYIGATPNRQNYARAMERKKVEDARMPHPQIFHPAATYSNFPFCFGKNFGFTLATTPKTQHPD
jgi:hypothetical protein